MIILLDSKDFPWCCYEEEQAQAPIMIALPTSRRFEGTTTTFPRRLHNFFTIEELSCPAVLAVDAARLAQAAYMRGWYARARVAACAAPRRSPHIA